MIGQLYINGKDAFETWGVFLLEGAYENLLLPSEMKEYTSNESRSQNGKQIFIENPKYKDRDVQIEFCVSSDTQISYLNKYKEFINELRGGVVIMNVPDLNEEYTLIVKSFHNLSYYERIGKFSVRFNEPYSEPVIFEVLADESSNILLTENNEPIII